MLKSRSTKNELIDLGPEYYTAEEYDDCMIKLERVGRWLGGEQATLSSLKKMDPFPKSILDVGCGGGHFTIKMAQSFPDAQVLGIDLNPQAITFAKKRLVSMASPPPNVSFEIRDQPSLNEHSKSYDVVTSTLVCHHMSDQELVKFLSQASSVAKQRVIINDLHRHPLAFYLFKMISPVLFRNRLVLHDGPLSVARGFSYQDLNDSLNKAGLNPNQHSIAWHFAFRWLVEIDCREIGND